MIIALIIAIQYWLMNMPSYGNLLLILFFLPESVMFFSFLQKFVMRGRHRHHTKIVSTRHLLYRHWSKMMYTHVIYGPSAKNTKEHFLRDLRPGLSAQVCRRGECRLLSKLLTNNPRTSRPPKRSSPS